MGRWRLAAALVVCRRRDYVARAIEVVSVGVDTTTTSSTTTTIIKRRKCTTPSGGSLGSRIDEERS